MFLMTALSADQNTSGPDAHRWYGLDPLVSSGPAWDGGNVDDDDQIFRKRRHRRKRKISPPRKGW